MSATNQDRQNYRIGPRRSHRNVNFVTECNLVSRFARYRSRMEEYSDLFEAPLLSREAVLQYDDDLRSDIASVRLYSNDRFLRVVSMNRRSLPCRTLSILTTHRPPFKS